MGAWVTGKAYLGAYDVSRSSSTCGVRVLERLGWTFHRIWSTDWFRNPQACADQAAAWKRAVERCDQDGSARAEQFDAKATGDGGTSTDSPEAGAASTPAEPTRHGPKPVAGGGRPITEYTPVQLDALVRWIRSDTLLRTRDEMIDEMIAELGYKRRGARILAAVEAAVDRTAK